MKDKYQLLNELQFQLGLAHRYAIITEHRISNLMDVQPYLNLLMLAHAEATTALKGLVPLLKPGVDVEVMVMTKQDLEEMINDGA